MNLPNGLYIVYPEGSCWSSHRVRNGRIIDSCQESDLASHIAARDRWSDMGPDDDKDREVVPDIADAVARAVLGPDVIVSMVQVFFRKR